jgi:hypothetical protein
MQGYQLKSEVKVSSLAFADDIILMASTDSDAEKLLRRTEEYMGDLGMNISAHKLATFGIKSTRDSWRIYDPRLSSITNEKIPFAGAEKTLRYLGGTFSPWKGLTAEKLEQTFSETLERVTRITLKPHQKAHLLTTYIIPHFLYTIILAMVPLTTMRKMDQDLRRVIKDIYHLPQCTANGLLNCGKKNGGLGIPRLETLATTTTLKMGLKLAQLKSEGKAVPAFVGDRIGNLAYELHHFQAKQIYYGPQTAGKCRRRQGGIGQGKSNR